jgi:hypothetical protein
MIVPSYLLLLLGLLGATDIWLFHTRAHHLHQHPPARAELVTHCLRGPTYGALFLLVPNFSFHGAVLAGLYALLLFDLAISIADFWLEPESRRALGGLPRGEYLLHVLMAMLFGALVAAVWYETGGALAEPAALRWQPNGAHPWLRAALAVMAIGVLWSGFADLAAVRRLARAPR